MDFLNKISKPIYEFLFSGKNFECVTNQKSAHAFIIVIGVLTGFLVLYYVIYSSKYNTKFFIKSIRIQRIAWGISLILCITFVMALSLLLADIKSGCNIIGLGLISGLISGFLYFLLSLFVKRFSYQGKYVPFRIRKIVKKSELEELNKHQN